MVDINRHPLIRQAYELCHAIEACGASEAQTNAAIKASKLMSDIEAEVTPGEAVGRETSGGCERCFTDSWTPVEFENGCDLLHPHKGEHIQCQMCRAEKELSTLRRERDQLLARLGLSGRAE